MSIFTLFLICCFSICYYRLREQVDLYLTCSPSVPSYLLTCSPSIYLYTHSLFPIYAFLMVITSLGYKPCLSLPCSPSAVLHVFLCLGNKSDWCLPCSQSVHFHLLTCSLTIYLYPSCLFLIPPTPPTKPPYGTSHPHQACSLTIYLSLP